MGRFGYDYSSLSDEERAQQFADYHNKREAELFGTEDTEVVDSYEERLIAERDEE